MSVDDKKKILKKRGRKPKSTPVITSKESVINSEEKPLITHLNLNSEDLLSFNKAYKNTDDNLCDDNLCDENLCDDKLSDSESIFIKEKENTLISESIVSPVIESSDIITELENKIVELTNKLVSLKKTKQNIIIKNNFNKNTKCWWCRNSFTSEKVGIPELYFNNKFYCFGNFCSYNCALAYNLDINDENIWKRQGLINLLYKKTYNINKNIKKAPHWSFLKEYGGHLSISKFRNASMIIDEEHILLQPPIEKRFCFYDKIYNSEIENNIINKDSNNLIIKRSKPLSSSQYTLDKNMIIKKKNQKTKMNNVTKFIYL